MISTGRCMSRILVSKLIRECVVMLPFDNLDLERPLSRLKRAGFFRERRNALSFLPEAAPT